MNTLLFVLLVLLGGLAVVFAAFVTIVFLDAAFGSYNEDMFDLEEEDF
jgi:hypothetical protein